MNLNELISKNKKCTRCRLRQGATQVVPGDGNPNADIMFIGEGPGANEDKQGVPFCGAAGKVLDELLDVIGIKRKDVYIANMVKCRPPGNRDPQPDEIEACKPWLDKQIELIKPKVIVTLGRFSMAKFLPDKKISQVHGEHFKVGDRVFFVLYHPAVALYNASQKETLIEDMKKLGELLVQIEQGDEMMNSEADEISRLMKKSKEKRREIDKLNGKQSSQIGLGV